MPSLDGHAAKKTKGAVAWPNACENTMGGRALILEATVCCTRAFGAPLAPFRPVAGHAWGPMRGSRGCSCKAKLETTGPSHSQGVVFARIRIFRAARRAEKILGGAV